MTDSKSRDPNAPPPPPSSPPPPPPEPLLEAVAREEGDPDLFPAEVLRLHADGHAGRARKALLAHADHERDQARAAKQLTLAQQVRLWLEPLRKAPAMHSVNGFGTALYGKYQPADDGTYVATLWIVLLFLPVWPLGAYLVRPAEQASSWYFLARAPLPPFGLRMRRVTRAALVGLLGLLAWKLYWTGAHTDLYVFNGFDRPVIAHVGLKRTTVPPRGHAAFPDLQLAPTMVAAAWEGEATPFESLSVDLAGHGRHAAIYNVAERAVLGVNYILYGDGEPRDGRLLGPGRVVFVDEHIDYLFATPPDSKKVSEGGRIENSVLHATDDSATAVDMVLTLMNLGRREQALAVGTAELMVHPEDGRLATLVVRSLLHGDFDAQLALIRGCLARAPGTVDLHRIYQDIWPEDRRDSVRAEYAALLRANPRSPMYHYLAGRLLEDGSEEASAHFRQALALDARYPPAYRALAWQAMVGERWTEALAHWDQFASLGSDEALEALDPRLRLRRRLGRPRSELERLVRETASRHDEPLRFTTLLAHLILEQRPAALEAETRRVLATIKTRFGLDGASPLARNVRADLALTAGDAAGARGSLAEIERPEQRSAEVALRVALGDGGTRADVDVLVAIPGWQNELAPPHRLRALALLDRQQREALITTLDPDVAAIARLLDTPGQGAQQLAAALRKQGLDVRAAALFAAGRVAEARSFALPGELP